MHSQQLNHTMKTKCKIIPTVISREKLSGLQLRKNSFIISQANDGLVCHSLHYYSPMFPSQNSKQHIEVGGRPRWAEGAPARHLEVRFARFSSSLVQLLRRHASAHTHTHCSQGSLALKSCFWIGWLRRRLRRESDLWGQFIGALLSQPQEARGQGAARETLKSYLIEEDPRSLRRSLSPLLHCIFLPPCTVP